MLRKERSGFEEKFNNVKTEKSKLQSCAERLQCEKEVLETTNTELEQALAAVMEDKDNIEHELNSVKFQLSTEALKNKRTLMVGYLCSR